MSDSPKDHDFDWVSARLECCEAEEFKRLRDLIERNCDRRSRSLSGRAKTDVRFVPVKNGAERFFVEAVPARTRDPRPLITVTFELKDCGICVWSDSQDSAGLPMTLTVRLNESGECRFAIDREGEYLRWQVACRALQSVLFEAVR